ncbi:MAG: c-type cytochrome [Proteobacteria bacterium]|nr:c-type cytochrome [Pseudomonadota bacterium]
MKRIVFAVLLGFSGAALAEGGMLQGNCATCHNIKGPTAQTLKAAFEKKGPDLFYAGNKYRQEWLVSWLQKPSRIRPAGMYYGGHIKAGAKGDEIDTSTLTDHIALSKADATSVAAELMKMKPHDDLIAKEKIESGTIAKQMGEMAFNKFLGCMACHLIEPEYGGLSGPELYTAAKRLQPQYMASFIRSPQAWDPKSMMPNKNLSDVNIQKMVHYLETLSKEAANAN